jgi:hypothetical protein
MQKLSKTADNGQDVTHRPKEQEPATPSSYCPVCSERLEARRCKLLCPVCGYYMSCSDYY